MAQLPLVSIVDVSKTKGLFDHRPPLLNHVNGEFLAGKRYAILGARGSGKTTLLNIMAGVGRPSTGHVVRRGVITPPLSSIGVITSYKTGLEIAHFMSRVFGSDGHETLRIVTNYFGLDEALLEYPLKVMQASDRICLSYAIGFSLPADAYLFDGDTQTGDEDFRSRCREALNVRRSTATTVVATHNPRVAEREADLGCLLFEGKLFFFPSVSDAVTAFHDTQLRAARKSVSYVKKLVTAGERGRAIGYLRDLLKEEPESEEAYIFLAELALRERRYEEAVNAADAALRLGGSSARALTLAAEAREALEDYEGALQCLEAIPQSDLDMKGLRSLARLYDRTGRDKEAGISWGHIAKSGDPVALRRAQSSLSKAKAWEELDALLTDVMNDQEVSLKILQSKFEVMKRLQRWPGAIVIIKEIAFSDSHQAISLIYSVIRSDDWLIGVEMLAVLSDDQVESVKSTRVTAFLEATLRRKLIEMRRAGNGESELAVEGQLRRLRSAS